MKIKDLLELKEDYLVSGHRFCAGCAEPIAIKLILKVLGERTILVNPTGCIEIVSSPYPENAWKIPYIHNAFENAGAVASGVEAALKVLMRKGKINDEKINVVAIGGDGSTADIGLQALSGAFERGHDLIYVCLDNEAYMNTGIQRSSCTPYAAWATTSPHGKVSMGETRNKKDLIRIFAAHDIPYVASASVAYPTDLAEKTKKAAQATPSYLHVHVPCCTGWRFDSSKTIELAKLAVQTGLFPIVEVKNGEVSKVRKIKSKKPVEEYLKVQGRFRHLFTKEGGEEEINRIQEIADANIARYNLMG